jgi:hypothetical protein
LKNSQIVGVLTGVKTRRGRWAVEWYGWVVSRPGQAVEVEMCVCVNICMNDGALRAVKKLYIRLCAARDNRLAQPL